MEDDQALIGVRVGLIEALHAQRLVFDHPISGRHRTFEAPLPEDFRSLLAVLREDAGGSL